MGLLIKNQASYLPSLKFSLILMSVSKASYSLSTFLAFKSNMDTPCAEFSLPQLLLLFYFKLCFVFIDEPVLQLYFSSSTRLYFFYLSHFCPMHIFRLAPCFCTREDLNYWGFMFSKIREAVWTSKTWHVNTEFTGRIQSTAI